MKSIIHKALVVILLVSAPFAVSAQENKAAIEAVDASLMSGTSHADIIRALTEEPYNMSLSDATVFAMNAGGDANRTAFVAAGIQSASTLPQAQSVATAVKASAGETGAVADAADAAMQEYARLMDQPFIHHDEDLPTGGGTNTGPGQIGPPVSPSA
jgi:hypothetical protein